MSAIAVRKALLAAAQQQQQQDNVRQRQHERSHLTDVSPAPSALNAAALATKLASPHASTSASASSFTSASATPLRRSPQVEEQPSSSPSVLLPPVKKKQRQNGKPLNPSTGAPPSQGNVKGKGRYFAGQDHAEGAEHTLGKFGSSTADQSAEEQSDSSSDASEYSHRQAGSKSSRPMRKTSPHGSPRPQNMTREYNWFSPVWKASEREQVFNAVLVENHQQESTSKGKAQDGKPPTIVLGLRAMETFSLRGYVQLRLLTGSITVDGVPLFSSQLAGPQVFVCPTTSPSPIISAQSSAEGGSSLAVPSTDLHQPQQSSILAASQLAPQDFDVILSLTPCTGSGLEALSRVCPLAGQDPFGSSGVKTASSAISDVECYSAVAIELQEEITMPFFHSIFQTRAHLKSHQLSQTPASWSAACEELRLGLELQEEPRIMMVRGPKGAGKSALARRLVNTLQYGSSQAGRGAGNAGGDSTYDIIFMDLDLGQGEFGVPGSVGLYLMSPDRLDQTTSLSAHPAWLTHTASPTIKPLLSHYLGQTTPRDVPSLYLAAVKSLADYFRTKHGSGVSESGKAGRPTKLVVNTMGWTKGLGAELAERIESIVQPDVIYDLVATLERPSGNYRQTGTVVDRELEHVMLPPARRGAPYIDATGECIKQGPRIVALQAIGLDLKLQEEFGLRPAVNHWPTRRLTAADQRILSIMTALHSAPVSRSSRLPAWDFSTSLLEQRPFVIDIRTGLAGGIQSFPPLAKSIDVGSTLAALNGELLGLAMVRDDVGQDLSSETVVQRDHSSDEADVMLSWTAFLDPVPLPLTALNFLSLVLIRSIDFTNGKLHLLCPHTILSILLSKIPSTASTSTSGAKLALIRSSAEAGSGSSGSVHLPVWASLDAPAILQCRSGRLLLNEPSISITAAAAGDDDDDDDDVSGEKTEASLAGVRLADVPYLEWPLDLHLQNQPSNVTADRNTRSSSGVVIGKEKRKVRRNLMRRNQGS